MTQPEALHQYILTHPTDDEGQDILFRFMLTLGKKLSDKVGDPTGEETIETRLIQAIGTIVGIDGVGIGAGRYTVEVTIARTFDPSEVIVELKRRLDDDVLSDIIRPSLITP